MKKQEKKSYRVLRWLASLLLGIFIVVGGFDLYAEVIFPTFPNLTWPVQLLIVITPIIPLMCFSLYFLFRLFLAHYTEDIPKGFRQWVVVCGFGLFVGLYLALLAFFFDAFASALPFFYKGVFLPLITLLLTILVLTRTRLSIGFERFLKRLYYGSNTKNESK